MAVRSPAAWALSFALALGAPLATSKADAQGAANRADGDGPSRAEELARDANKAFERFLKGEDPRGVEPALSVSGGGGNDPGRPRHAIESGSDWLVRVQRNYQALIERLSAATVPNPVVDAAERQAAERAKLWARKGAVERAPGERVVIGEGDQATLIGDARELLDKARRETQAGVRGPLNSTGSTGAANPVPSGNLGGGELTQPQERGASDAQPTEEQTVAQASSDPTSAAEQPAETEQSKDYAGALGWLNRGYLAFQRDVVGKLAAMPKDGVPPAASKDPSPATGLANEVDRREAGTQLSANSEDTAAGVPKTGADTAGSEAAASPVATRQATGEDTRQLEEARRAEMLRKAEKARRAAELRTEAVTTAEAERQAEAGRAAEAARLAEAKATESARTAEAERQAETLRAAEAERLAEAKAAEAAKKREAERIAEARKDAEAAKRAEAWAAEMARLAELRRAAEQRAVADARRAKDAAEHVAAETARLTAEPNTASAAGAETSSGTSGGTSSGQSSAPANPSAVPHGPPEAAKANGAGESDKAARRVAELARVAEARARKEADRAAAAVKSIEAAKRVAESADRKARRRADRLIEREAKSVARAAKRAVAAAAVLGRVAPVSRPVASTMGPGPIARPEATTRVERRLSRQRMH